MRYFLDLKKKIDWQNVSLAFFLISIFFVIFPVRHVFLTDSSTKTGIFSDFTTFSLYISDIFIFFSFVFILPRGVTTWYSKSIKIFIIYIFLILIINIRNFNQFSVLSTIKILELSIVAYGTSYFLSKRKSNLKKILYFFVFCMLFQSIIGISQFFIQKSVGLSKIGESQLNYSLFNVAKIVSGGTVIIRAYGTFPHPNIFAAFLLTSIAITLYFILRSEKAKISILLITALFVQISAILLTFSRTGIFCLGLILLISGYFFLKGDYFKKQALLWVGLLIYFLVFGVALSSPLSDRINNKATENVNRTLYIKIGINIVKSYPLFGIGVGESVLHMKQFSPIPLKPWDIQPIHNYFLLSASEMGLTGALLLMFILFNHIKNVAAEFWKKHNQELFFLSLILLIFLILMQFDHYFYTTQQAQLLLWMVLGIIAAQTKKSVSHETENS